MKLKPVISQFIGFATSVILTLAAFAMTAAHVNSEHQTFSHTFLTGAIIVLAILQLIIQATFFLELGEEKKPRTKLLSFFLTLEAVIIVVGGSLWIMHNLDYRMTPEQVNTYVEQSENIVK